MIVLCLGEPPGGFYDVALHSCLFFLCWLLCISGLLFPCHRHSELYPWYFSLLYFSVYNERYEFEWAFFTLRSFPTFLSQPAFIKASLGAGSCSLKFAGLHVDHRNVDPTHLFVWFTAFHNLDTQENLSLNRTKYYHELLVVKSLVYLLLTRFEFFSLVQSHM